MMKKLFFILTTFIFFCSKSFAADCSAVNINPTIKVTSSYGKLSYDTSKNIEEITTMAKNFNLVESGLFASGLSTVNVNFDITINTLGQLIGDSEYCVIPTEVTIFIGLDSPTIYVSNNISENSCEHHVILRHEKTHQQINKTTLEYYLPFFKDAALKIIKDIKPIKISDIKEIEQSTASLTKLYNSKMTKLVDFIKREMIIEQKKLDNPENYHFESTLCKK